MMTTLVPTLFMLHLPPGDCSDCLSKPIFGQESGQDVIGPSTVSVDVSPRLAQPGGSTISFANLLALGAEFPHVRVLHLNSVLVHPDASPCDLPRFSFLESLSIDPRLSPPSGYAAAITRSLLALFPHMPRLRSLISYAPMARLDVEQADHEIQYPCPPFSLERLVRFGTLPVSACTPLIAHSRGTLQELRMNIVGHADAEEAVLIAAIAQAAPYLRVLDLRLRGDSRLLWRAAPVFASLARVDTLHVELPQNAMLEDALALLAGAHARTLSIRFPRGRHGEGAAVKVQRIFGLLQTPRLRNLTLMGLNMSIEDDRALCAHGRARRIRCTTHIY